MMSSRSTSILSSLARTTAGTGRACRRASAQPIQRAGRGLGAPRLWPCTSPSPPTIARQLSSSNDSSNLPYHLVVGLPALSPTMASGALAEWYVSEGDKFAAGDAVAKIETDKATIDFEAQDDGYVAKLLMEAGTGSDIAVGTPIMITVEEEDNVAAFKNYTPPPLAAAAAPAAEPAKVETAPPPPPPPPSSPAPAPPAAAAAAGAPPAPPAAAPIPPPTLPPPPPPAVASLSTATTPPIAVPWGSLVQTSSPLVKSLAKKQRAYVELYGTTGQRPVL